MIKLLFSLCFSGVALWVYYGLFLRSILVDNVTNIYFDPFYGISFLFLASMGFLLLLPLNVLCGIFYKRDLKIKSVGIALILFGVLGTGVNYLNSLIISDDHYIQCPSKIGYKKNLLRNYVKDIRQCEITKKG